MFEIFKKDKKTKKRTGLISTKHGGITTPVFMPIATYGAVKNLTPEELADLGAQLLIEIIPQWINKKIKPAPQNDAEAAFTKIIEKEDGKIN